MPLHAVVSFELRWQFINDSSLGWAPLEVLTLLNFTPNHFRWPFPRNSNGLLSLSQAFHFIVLWHPTWYKCFFKKHRSCLRVPSPTEASQWLHSRTAAMVKWSNDLFQWSDGEKEGKVNEAIEGNPGLVLHDVVFEGVDRQPSIPPIGGWYDSRTKTLYFVRTFSRARMNR